MSSSSVDLGLISAMVTPPVLIWACGLASFWGHEAQFVAGPAAG
jgi:hypothetical protein